MTDNINSEILESTFVDKPFYVEPPAKNAPVSEWLIWQEKDDRERAKAKAKHTRIQNILAEATGQVSLAVPEMTVRKINGCYRQVAPVALTGDFEEGTGSLEPAQDAQQDKEMIRARQQAENKRGSTTGSSRSARRRAAKRADRARR